MEISAADGSRCQVAGRLIVSSSAVASIGRRIARTKELLETTDLLVEEIARLVGLVTRPTCAHTSGGRRASRRSATAAYSAGADLPVRRQLYPTRNAASNASRCGVHQRNTSAERRRR